jgi:hypothetical protein
MGRASTSVRLGPVSLAELLARRRRLSARDGWTRTELETHQRDQLERLRRFAVERSPFYREFHSGKTHAPLGELPVLSTKTLMGRWDDVITERSVKLDDVLKFVEGRVAVGTRFLRTGERLGFRDAPTTAD